MGSQCCTTDIKFDGLSPAYRRTLLLIIALNGIMFVVEIIAGFSAQSQALKADALDFLADTATYAISLAVIGAPLAVRSTAALVKGFSLALMGLWVLGSTAYVVWSGSQPDAPTMGVVAIFALGANLASVLLLLRYRDGDANVRSVWLCSRNDAIGNVAVMAAASGVWASGTSWPDFAVAAIMAGLFLTGSVQIIRQALRERGSGSSSRDLHPAS